MQLNWGVVTSNQWSHARDKKQAEFLCEQNFAWELVERIGVNTQSMYQQVQTILASAVHKPTVAIKNDWYY